MTDLDKLLNTYRTTAISSRDQGTAFEKLISAWLVTDPVQANRFALVQSWATWASCHELHETDTGIDLVATRHDGKFAAVQCKFFKNNRKIAKEDIDSFISASAKRDFAERLIIETTDVPWSPHAETMLQGQTIPTIRIGLRELRESQVDWSMFEATGTINRPKPKKLREDQVEALKAVQDGLTDADRGKLIMACGTGKTLTALRIAEEMTGSSGFVLLLVPSLALMSQTIREWCTDTCKSLTAFAVCSDSQVGRRRLNTDDIAELEATDLVIPPTTKSHSLATAVKTSGNNSLCVVFATYQSISVIESAQTDHGMPKFNLIVCDEAHRTTGVTFSGADQSDFVKVHDNDVIRGDKRLYMTATPRIYGENAKSKASEAAAALASMDDTQLYGEVLFHHGFARAVESNILTDYRVVVLVMDEQQVSTAVQNRLSDRESELVLDDATKIVGCWKALSKHGLIEQGEGINSQEPMRRALAFCRSIASSKLVRNEFARVVSEYQSENIDALQNTLKCEVRHVDGTYKARDRGERLDWLREDSGEDVCRILSNAKCLTEGVDVPALDAILFLHPRNSQIDVVQAVGRVMRSSPGKQMGYVILPIGVPPGIPAHEALNDNERFRVVWQILNALRAHDERLDTVINQGGLGQNVGDRISIIDGRSLVDGKELDAVTATVDELPAQRNGRARIGIGKNGDLPPDKSPYDQLTMPIVIDEFTRAVMAKIVEKCGTRDYWEDWAKDVAEIAERHVTRISSLIENPGSDANKFFNDFLEELRDDLNESISKQDAIEMLAQHKITKPVFDALFEDHEFVERNPVSVAMTDILSVIDESQIEREAKSLEGFYASVRRRARGISDPQAKQKLIVELYDKFFRTAFPRATKMLGIVYTPVEVVDFILHSVNEVLQNEFGKSLGTEGVHILDPFVGTGTFITRLLQSGLIPSQQLKQKYCEEIHTNEIVLLAYYIAAINIETVFHAIDDCEGYLPYTGICLTDTFALHEGDDELAFYMKDNTDRRERQKNTEIRVIVGNPPYSFGQQSQNDNARNVKYSSLDEKIRRTYAERSNASNKQNLYDSYIRAIRWGSDRVGDSGVITYVTNAGWLEANAMDGFRKCLAEEFASIYVFHLRGNARTSGEERRKEKGNIFGEGSRAPIAITILVKNPNSTENGTIRFHDIGDYLNRQEKLDKIRDLGSISGVEKIGGGWTHIVPDEYGDWLKQRDSSFENYPKLGDKSKNGTNSVIFENYSTGVATNRDAWCVNPSRTALVQNIESTIDFYNIELRRWNELIQQATLTGQPVPEVDDFVNNDRTKISWSRSLKQNIRKQKDLHLNNGSHVPCMYRPFTKNWQYFSRQLNEVVSQMPQIFPNAELPNRIISVTGNGSRNGLSVFMADRLVDLNLLEAGAQCFPLWLYENAEHLEPDLLSTGDTETSWSRRDAITSFALDYFYATYPNETISREDIFHYIYGLLHSEDYRSRYSANLAKELPRIPCVKSVRDYCTFRDVGKKLGELHVNYESVDSYPAKIDMDGRVFRATPEELYRVTKMKHPGTGANKDMSTVIYNSYITIREIPKDAWNYVISGKPALSWIMERQSVKTDKASGIVSDSNHYAIETMEDPRYVLDLFLRVITVSLETMKLVRSLPELKLE